MVEEILYPAMEDHVLGVIIGEGPSARSVRIDLSPFTLVAATTRAGLLATPLRDRFGIPLRLEFYTPAELTQVLAQASRKMGVSLAPEGAEEIARRARAAQAWSMTSSPSAPAKSRTRRSSRPATRGVPRARLAISDAPSSDRFVPIFRAAPVSTRCSSSAV